MILQTKLINHFFAVFSQLVFICFALLALIYFDFENPILIAFTIGFLLNNTPAMYLHYEYWKVNNGKTYEITNNEIIRRKGGTEERFHFKEIEKIVVYKSASADKGGIILSSVEAYYYVRIIHQSGQEMILTCLLSTQVDKAVKRYRGVPFERKKWLFCSIKRK